ncbi:MAG TPA: hypothetical protein VKY27_00720 [Bacteriovoracaceae bacterium]|nr:hypothetical protein [Bacteriovoracaceae bacterium]
MNLSNWVFERFGREHYSPGLERMRFALGESLHQLNQIKIVTIVGTNGKGETTLRLARKLQEKRFAAWTSPHVKCLTERFRNHEGLISHSDLKALLEKTYQEVVEKKFQLSFYEFLFLVFCRWVEQQDLDYLLLEVGLGGEFDAVNVLDANLVLLPSISRDHQEFLGNRYDGILKEKLGVLRAGSTLISFLDLNYLNERIEEKVFSIGVKWLNFSKFTSDFNFSQKNQFLAHVGADFLLGKLDPVNPTQNLIFDESKVENRGEVVCRGEADFHLFGSHNVDGMRKLIQFLHSGIYTSNKLEFNTTIISFSARSKKDLETMMKMLKGRSALGKVIVTHFSHPKACEMVLLRELSLQEGLEFVEDINAYISSILSGRVLVAGSYYFLSHIKSLLGQ